MKARLAHTGLGASSRAGIPDKFKLISARSLSALSRSFFFTHGWVNQRTHFDSFGRRDRALHRATEKRAHRRAHLQRALRILCVDALAKIRHGVVRLAND